MQSKQNKNLIIVRLFPDEDIFEKLREICKKHQINTAVVISGIGQLKNFKLGYFKKKGDYTPQYFEKPHEILSLEGNIVKQDEEYIFHLHAVLGDENKKAIGGHLIEGVVEVTNEIVLLKVNVRIHRKLENTTGLEGMFLE